MAETRVKRQADDELLKGMFNGGLMCPAEPWDAEKERERLEKQIRTEIWRCQGMSIFGVGGTGIVVALTIYLSKLMSISVMLIIAYVPLLYFVTPQVSGK